VFATSTGGVGRHVGSLAAGLVERGMHVTVHGAPEAEDLFAFSSVGAEFAPVAIPRERTPMRDLTAVRMLRNAAKSAEIVHAHGLRASAISVAAIRHAPVVSTWHNAVLGSALRRRGYAWIERRIARRADIVFGASSDLVARARRFGARDARLGPIAAPHLPRATRDRDAVRVELGATDRPLVVAVSRLSMQKRLDVLVDAARILAGRTPIPLVVIAGSGPMADDLASRIETTGAPVTLLGHRDDVADLLQAADVVALPSAWEARALVAQEALRAGRPLVATAVGGIPELVGDAAVLVPPGDPRAFADALAEVLGNPDVAARLAAAGRVQSTTWPDERATIDIIVSAYADALGART
jgi:glycosyltransferase involved in cell wall biosynthesis